MDVPRGEEYLRDKVDYGWKTARGMSRKYQNRYTLIKYYALPSIRKRVRRTRAGLIEQGG